MVGPAVALVSLVVGILAGEHAAVGPAGSALVVGVAALGAAWFGRSYVRVVLISVALALLGLGVMSRSIDGRQHSALTPGIARRATVTLEGELTSDPSGGQFGTSVFVRVRGAHRIVLAAASGDDAMHLRVLDAGDRVVVRGRLGPLRSNSFDDYARWRHAVGRLDDAHLVAVAPARGMIAIANAARDFVLRGTRPLAPTTRALTAGFLLGDTRGIPKPIADEYRDAGLSHLLAVSGENVAFVLAVAGPLLRRLRLRARTATALALVVLFATMTRFEPSVLRASTMAAIALLASAAGRPASTVRALAYAAIALLLVDPFLIHSAGFALSCAASAGIGLAAGPIGARLPGPRFVREPLAVSLGAQVGVIPVLLWTFGTFPLVTPLTNLLAAPAAQVLGVYGFCASIVASAVPGCGALVQQPTALLVAWVSTVAHAGAARRVSLDARGAFGCVSVGAAIASVACLECGRSGATDGAAREP
jgi:competence protein ComEC